MDVHINLVSRRVLEHMSTQEKIRFILDEVKRNRILVLEEGLNPIEEAQLIERTMTEIDPDTFIGIEMESQRPGPTGFLQRILKRSTFGGRATMTVVGPADRLRTVHKNGDVIEAMIVTGKGAA